MTTFSTLLRYDYFSTPSHYVYLFHHAPLCLLFPRCCAVSTVSILLLRYVYFFHAAALCLLFPRCRALSTFSTLLHKDYFHALIQEFSSGGGGGDPGQSDKKALTTSFSLVLILFYRSQMVNFKEYYHFSRFRRGSNFFFQVCVCVGGQLLSREGVQLLISLRTPYNL